MHIKVLQAKIRHAHITGSSPDYKGSITIDQDILDDLGLVPFQAVDVNLKGDDQYGRPFRGETYILPGPRGTGCIEANGALACHISKGDIVHVNAYALISARDAINHVVKIIEDSRDYKSIENIKLEDVL